MEQTMSLGIPGQTFTLTARLYNRGKTAVTPGEVRVEVPEGWSQEKIAPVTGMQPLNPNDVSTAQFKISVPEHAQFTRPSFTRHDPAAETLYTISEPELVPYPSP